MYADCFLIPIKKTKLASYKRMAQLGCRTWMKFGALDYQETVGDDLRVKGMVSFAKAARLKAGETVIVAWITFKSKAHRDKVNAKVHAYFGTLGTPPEMPFDPGRMSYGGFKVLVGRKR